jgi:hypothetical protein
MDGKMISDVSKLSILKLQMFHQMRLLKKRQKGLLTQSSTGKEDKADQTPDKLTPHKESRTSYTRDDINSALIGFIAPGKSSYATAYHRESIGEDISAIEYDDKEFGDEDGMDEDHRSFEDDREDVDGTSSILDSPHRKLTEDHISTVEESTIVDDEVVEEVHAEGGASNDAFADIELSVVDVSGMKPMRRILLVKMMMIRVRNQSLLVINYYCGDEESMMLAMKMLKLRIDKFRE